MSVCVCPSPVMKPLQERPCRCTVRHLQVNITHSDQTASAVLLEAFLALKAVFGLPR